MNLRYIGEKLTIFRAKLFMCVERVKRTVEVMFNAVKGIADFIFVYIPYHLMK